MGSNWSKEEAIEKVTKAGQKALNRYSGSKFIVNWGGKKWYESKVIAASKTQDGVLSNVTFKAICDDDKKTVTGAEGIAGSVSLICRDFEAGDEVVCYWNPSGNKMYKGTCIEIDMTNSVCRCKMGDGDDSWLPLSYVHKFVKPTASDFK